MENSAKMESPQSKGGIKVDIGINMENSTETYISSQLSGKMELKNGIITEVMGDIRDNSNFSTVYSRV
jgi:hypothetical protein